MNKLDIICFTSAARTRNFSLTAKELMISQQAVSKHIRHMEEEIGYPLFFRSAGMVELTRAGTYMLEYLLARNEVVDDIKKFVKSGRKSALDIACSQWVGCPPVFGDALRSFQKDNPDIPFHVHILNAAEMLDAIREEKADLLLASHYSTQYFSSLWKTVPVFPAPVYLIRSRHSASSRDQLNSYPFYAVEAGENSENAVFLRVRRTCRKLGLSPANILVQPNMGSVMMNLLLTDGLTLGTWFLHEIAKENFVFEQTGLQANVEFCMPFHPADPNVQVMADYLSEYMNRALTEGRHPYDKASD